MIKKRLGAVAAVLLGGVLFAHPACTESLPVEPDLVAAGWKVLTFAGKSATRFTGRADGAIEVAAAGSVAILYRRVSGQDQNKRQLNWRWRVETTMPATDLSRIGYDDRPLALHVWFPEDRAGVLKTLAAAVAGLFDVPFPGKVLTYVWGGTGRRGDWLTNPHLTDDGVMIILRGGDTPTGHWFTEQIDFAADFERVFHYEAPAPSFVAVSADADDTMGQSLALVRDIVFADGFGGTAALRNER